MTGDLFKQLWLRTFAAPADGDKLPGVEYVTVDIRTPGFSDVLKNYSPDVVVHLAAVVTPGRKSDRDFEYLS